MTPLLPTLGQDFGEVGQKPSYAALYNLLLKFPKKHASLTSRPCLLLFLHQTVSSNFQSNRVFISLTQHPTGNNFCKLNRQQLVVSRIDFEQQ